MIKRSVVIRGHRTSVSLEEPFWSALREIAVARGVSVAAMIRDIDDERSKQMTRRSDSPAADAGQFGGLSSAIRIAVLKAARSGALQDAKASRANPTDKSADKSP